LPAIPKTRENEWGPVFHLDRIGDFAFRRFLPFVKAVGRKLGKSGSNADKFHKVDTKKLIADIARGIPIGIACAAVGIVDQTFQNWLDQRPEFAREAGQVVNELRRGIDQL
jgi:hypothetical protein